MHIAIGVRKTKGIYLTPACERVGVLRSGAREQNQGSRRTLESSGP